MEGKKKNILFIATVLFLTSACAAVGSNKSGEVELGNKEKTKALIESIETGNPEPVGYVNPPKKSFTFTYEH